jgi:hypothetical protein
MLCEAKLPSAGERERERERERGGEYLSSILFVIVTLMEILIPRYVIYN